MRPMVLLFIVLLSGFYSAEASAALVPPQYDLDSLNAKASVIVKAEITGVSTIAIPGNNRSVYDVNVITVLKGEIPARVEVATNLEYRKGPGIGAADDACPPLAAGDVVYLYLEPNLYLRTADGRKPDWAVICSGARLVSGGAVYGFAQYWGPGIASISPRTGLVCKTPETFPGTVAVSIAEYDERQRKSAEFVVELRLKVESGAFGEIERRELLDRRLREVTDPYGQSFDYIPTLLIRRPSNSSGRPSDASR